VKHSAKSSKKLVLEEEIVREIKALWTGPTSDVRTALLKEMFGSVVKLRDLDTDFSGGKIFYRALKRAVL
jgi:hypothetical protein